MEVPKGTGVLSTVSNIIYLYENQAKSDWKFVVFILCFDGVWRPGLRPSPSGTLSWPLCYCYDGSMRLEAVNNIHYRRKIRPKVNWQFYDFISYLEDVLRIEAVHNWTLITWEGPPTSEIQPGEVAGRVEPNKQCLAELSGVWVLQIAANTTCLQGDYRVEDKNSRPREDIDF